MSLAALVPRVLAFGLTVAAFTPAIAQSTAPASAPATQALPLDPHVKVGTLRNGMRYYIRTNAKPEKRAELRLVVNTGSVLEDDDQQGLAHFLEHMAFNGTRRFAKNELVSYLESVGMRFGPDINASTGFDETIYMLQVPTDTASIVEKGFQILEDWARFQTLDSAEIDKERGVVIEEWRMGQGAGTRMQNKQLPIILRGSRYALRLPIGKKETLESFRPAALRRFYTDWYRPDLMAIVAVGDFDEGRIERLIREHFSDIPAVAKPRPRTRFGVPAHDSTLVAIATDKEATGSNVAVYYLRPDRPDTTVGSYRDRIVAQLYNRMLNQRFFELTQKPDAPFLGASSSQGGFLGDKEAFILAAAVKDNGIERGLGAVLTEAARVQRYGFTSTELDRHKQDVLRAMERAYAERDKTQSADHADEYVVHYLEGEPVPGIAYEYELYKRFIPGIQLAEVNALGKAWMGDRDRVITVNAPDKPGLVVPSEAKLIAAFDAVSKKEIAAYEDAGPQGSLVDQPPRPGTIVATSELKELGVTRWTLSNGVRVILKPTDFKADQILVRGYSPGGTSLLGEKEFASTRGATTLLGQGGIGKFSRVELQKALSGKAVSVSPSINELSEEVFGSGSPKDIETLFQLIYLNFTAPRADSAAVLAFKERQRAALENRGASPEAAFVDTLQVTLTQHHPRTRPISTAIIDSLDLERSLTFYRDRFGDASDFSFIIVGNFAVDSIRPLVLQYLAGLPASGRKETWKDVGVNFPRGVVKREVRRGSEPKALTQLFFTGSFDWSRENRYALSALEEVLRIRLRDEMREAQGGVYDVSIDAEAVRDPKPRYQIAVGFGSAPERAAPLTATVFAQIDSIKANGPRPGEIEKVREIQRRADETGRRENGYWLTSLWFADVFGEDPRQILERDKLFASLTPAMVRDAARRYLDTANYVQVSLQPETRAAAPTP